MNCVLILIFFCFKIFETNSSHLYYKVDNIIHRNAKRRALDLIKIANQNAFSDHFLNMHEIESLLEKNTFKPSITNSNEGSFSNKSHIQGPFVSSSNLSAAKSPTDFIPRVIKYPKKMTTVFSKLKIQQHPSNKNL